MGLLFLGDGATISRCLLSNILNSTKKIPVAVLEILYFQGNLSNGNKKDGTFICNLFLNHMKEMDPAKTLSDIVMFDVVLNVQLAGRLLEVYYPKLTVMSCVEHTVLLFSNDFSKISIVNKMISAHKMRYNIFGSGIYHNPHSIFKSRSQEFRHINMGTFSGNETRIAEYFMGMHRDLWMRKVLQDTIAASEFISIPTNNKPNEAVRYIHDNNS